MECCVLLFNNSKPGLHMQFNFDGYKCIMYSQLKKAVTATNMLRLATMKIYIFPKLKFQLACLFMTLQLFTGSSFHEIFYPIII